jgi:hypothetical protein
MSVLPFNRTCVVVSLAVVFSAGSVEGALAEGGVIDYYPPEEEDVGVAPNFIFSAGERWLILETYDSEYHVFDENFNLIGSRQINGLGPIVDASMLQGRLVVVDETGRQASFVEIPDEMLSGSSGEAAYLATSEIVGQSAPVVTPLPGGGVRLEAGAEATLGQRPTGGESLVNPEIAIDLEPLTEGGIIEGWEVVGRMNDGSLAVYWIERHTLQSREVTRHLVARVSQTGIQAITEVPVWLSEMPVTIPVAVDAFARVVQLRIDGGIQFAPLVFETLEDFGRSFFDDLRIEAVIEHHYGHLERSEIRGGEAGFELPQTDRMEILERAREYARTLTTLGNQNLSGGSCDPRTRHQLPSRLSNAVGGSVFIGMPYAWGGWDSLNQYHARIQEGDLAGDVCTRSRYSRQHGSDCPNDCVVADAVAGIDCSGLVTRVWGIEHEKQSTRSLAGISAQLASVRDLQPGDIMLRAGSHVYLVTAVELRPLSITVIDSSVSRGGVAERLLSSSQLSGYLPFRYLGVEP